MLVLDTAGTQILHNAYSDWQVPASHIGERIRLNGRQLKQAQIL